MRLGEPLCRGFLLPEAGAVTAFAPALKAFGRPENNTFAFHLLS
jgi:hypothetical protein